MHGGSLTKAPDLNSMEEELSDDLSLIFCGGGA